MPKPPGFDAHPKGPPPPKPATSRPRPCPPKAPPPAHLCVQDRWEPWDTVQHEALPSVVSARVVSVDPPYVDCGLARSVDAKGREGSLPETPNSQPPGSAPTPTTGGLAGPEADPRGHAAGSQERDPTEGGELPAEAPSGVLNIYESAGLMVHGTTGSPRGAEPPAAAAGLPLIIVPGPVFASQELVHAEMVLRTVLDNGDGERLARLLRWEAPEGVPPIPEPEEDLTADLAELRQFLNIYGRWGATTAVRSLAQQRAMAQVLTGAASGASTAAAQAGTLGECR